jgi:hypothetical protein
MSLKLVGFFCGASGSSQGAAAVPVPEVPVAAFVPAITGQSPESSPDAHDDAGELG